VIHKASLTPQQVEEDFLRVFSFVKQDREEGLIRWADTPYPLMLVWSPRIYEFLSVMERVMTYHPARGMCREVGFRSGFDGAREGLRPMGVDEVDRVGALLAMPRILVGTGWGVSEIEYDDVRDEVAWTFPRGTAVGVAARNAGRRATPACAFVEGFGAGWVKGSLDRSVEFMETACVGMGDPACRFASRPME
jgi:hypothetical protein